ncbi:MAG: hypothetical protein ABEL04_01520 [Salinibacter sp.]|uniref:hypothetical protein n=1 Tax=Salinibacter sp. TaxID=2065818 RepID=UPI0035D4B805
MTIWSSGRQLSVSQITMRDLHSFAFEGTLHALQNQVVYVPLNFPVVMTFSPSDTTGTAYPTPDYGDPRPKVQTTDNGRTFAPTTHMNRDATLHNGMLTVRKPTPDVDSIAFDLYDANDMSYEHSIRFPYDLRRGDRAMHAHGRVLAIARDTTVALYRVHHPEQ